jgi:hypothetical protein
LIAAALDALPVERFVLDGELVVLDNDGHSNFAKLAHGWTGTHYSFDLHGLAGQPWRCGDTPDWLSRRIARHPTWSQVKAACARGVEAGSFLPPESSQSRFQCRIAGHPWKIAEIAAEAIVPTYRRIGVNDRSNFALF